jgi:RNA polymerase subunit RPABC4/transcription elongation factor Spt4
MMSPLFDLSKIRTKYVHLLKKTNYLVKVELCSTCDVCDTHMEWSNLINVINVTKINHLNIIGYDYNVNFNDVTILNK